jgi:hypothetical protein
MDPIVRLARQRIVKACMDLEVQISSVKGGGPCVEILRVLQERSAESLAALAIVDAEDPKAIRTLQNEVKRYDEWFGAIRDIISQAKIYEAEFTEDDRNELLDLLIETPEGQQQAIDMGLVDEIPRDA